MMFFPYINRDDFSFRFRPACSLSMLSDTDHLVPLKTRYRMVRQTFSSEIPTHHYDALFLCLALG